MVGDFNARLMERLPAEEDTIGKFIYRNEEDTIEKPSPKQLENRENIDWCTTMSLVPINTWKEKKLEDVATFRSVGIEKVRPPFDTRIFAQLDFVPAPKNGGTQLKSWRQRTN